MKEAKSNATIGLWSAIAISIGEMIGASIFSILGLGIKINGNFIYISFSTGGIIAILCAFICQIKYKISFHKRFS